MFLNKQISLALVMTYTGWAIAIGTWIVSWIIDSTHLGQGGILIALVAAVATSRLYATEQARSLHNALTIVRGAESVTPLSRH